MSLKIGALIIPRQAGFTLRQSYDPILARTLLRSKSGAGIGQTRWAKLRSSITGSGWQPAALDAIDLSIMHAVHCVETLSAYSATTAVTIPHTYRTDTGYTVQAWALVGNILVSTPVSMAGQVATVTAVSGALQYQVDYYPIITGLVTISKSGDVDAQTKSWTIEIEQQ